MKKSGSINSVLTTLGQSKQHLSDLGSGVRSRLRDFRRGRSQFDQQQIAEDFSRVLLAWGIDDVAAIPAVIRALRLRYPVFTLPVIGCLIAAILLQTFVSFLVLAFVALPCLLGLLTTAWRISILENCCFLSFPRWLLTGAGLFRERR